MIAAHTDVAWCWSWDGPEVEVALEWVHARREWQRRTRRRPGGWTASLPVLDLPEPADETHGEEIAAQVADGSRP